MELEDTRKNIDRIDREILKLLNRRLELALRTRNLKGSVEDFKREKRVLENVQKNSLHLVSSLFAGKLFQEIIRESKRLQGLGLKLVGFQGEHGAFGESAICQRDPQAIPIPSPEFVDVFEGVKKGVLDFGVVPVENSIEGGVNPVNDLLIETDLNVIGEVNIAIHHCLLALPDTDYREIKVVYSHPLALGQCRGFLSRNRLEQRPYYDTAGSAAMLTKERPKAAAAIASALCAEIYNLEVLKENIEDDPSNFTRFLIIARDKETKGGNKCSLVFITAHKAGALFEVLKVFSEAKINLTRIESRPIRNEKKNFAFLLDFQGSQEDPLVKEALQRVQEKTQLYRFLGCYEEAPLP